MRCIIFLFLFVFIPGLSFGFFDLGYDFAVSKAQQGKWQEAKDAFSKLVLDRSEDPDVLYDAGVVSNETKDFQQAEAYFKNVTTNSKASLKLKEAAHYNLGM